MLIWKRSNFQFASFWLYQTEDNAPCPQGLDHNFYDNTEAVKKKTNSSKTSIPEQLDQTKKGEGTEM